MRYLGISIDGFGGIAGGGLVFGPGLMIIHGANETGKSTTVRAMTASLFGWDGRRRRDRELSARYRPWASGEYSVAVELEAGGSVYRIRRDFTDGSAECWVLDQGSWRPVPPGVPLEAGVGTTDEGLFRSLLVLSQAEVGELDRKRVGEALSAKLTGSGDDVTGVKALGTLRKRMEAIAKKGQTIRTQGELQAVEARIAGLRERLEKARGYMEERDNCLASIARLEAELAGTDLALASVRPLLEGGRSAEEARERLDAALEGSRVAEAKLKALAELDAQADKARRVLEGLAGREAYLTPSAKAGFDAMESKRLLAAAALDERMRAAERLQGELDRARRRLATIGHALEGVDPSRYSEEFAERVESLSIHLGYMEGQRRIERQANGPGHRNGLRAVAVFVGLSVVVALLFRVLVPSWGMAALLPGIVAGALGLAAGLGMPRKAGDGLRSVRHSLDSLLGGESLAEYREGRRRYRQLQGQQRESESTVAAAEGALSALDADGARRGLADAEAVLRSFLDDAGFATAGGYLDAWTAYRTAREETERLARERVLILDGRDAGEWEAKALDAMGAIRYERSRLSGGLPLEEASRLEAEAAALTAVRAEHAAGLERLRGRLEQLSSASPEDPWTISAELDDAMRYRSALLFEAEALECAVSALEASIAGMQGDLIPDVCRRAGELLGTMTMGRYGGIRLSDLHDGLTVGVLEPDTGRWVEPESLSTGTRDQVYIALRIALAEGVTGKESLPFILDDPFTNLDADRLGAAVSALVGLSGRHQVIWFTKDRSLCVLHPELPPAVELGRHVVRSNAG